MIHEDDIVIMNKEPTFNPYNPVNQQISLNEVQTILTTYGITKPLTNIKLYQRAFVHSSYCKRTTKIKVAPCPSNCMPLKSKSNERLEFLGDGILEGITKYYLYRRFFRENEGFMTEKKIALVKNEAIGKLALDMGLSTWYILSKHSEDKKIRSNLKKLGCLFEAFLGALFLDYDFQTAQTFVETIFEKHIDWTELILCDDNYKNILQVKLQKEFKTTPEYVELGHNDNYHTGVYLCLGQPIWKVDMKDAIPYSTFGSFDKIHMYLKTHKTALIHLGEGLHKIKKKSEQLACEHALKLL
jgi:dsRNA-specific ribonuclease